MKIVFVILAFLFVSTVHAEFRTDVKATRASNAAEIKEDRLKLKDDIKERRADFKLKIAKIKDEKKKAIVEKLDIRFNEVNAKRTAQMTKHLDRMSEILGKVTGDTASAGSAIEIAREAVTAQGEKTYVITISTEANLKMDVGKVRSQLEADLKAVNELVKSAREAVKSLLK